ncbi:hypothetical protein GNP84_13675 [Aliivibrio fischeri]|uniref:hypothetical protein n=1 Tax=Aliivibrio fischeri TaxID=668 RepID=UPI0012D8B741|nr:hypothetical protein [Aliivibrio fischeri]MUK77932.1 hypothetical protein [Aliivibrio fischeri]
MTLERKPNEAYLALIQGIITRMATNSFMIKGWSLTVIVALIAFSGSITPSSNDLKVLLLISICTVVIFFYMDAYFFYQENLYRDLYNQAILKEFPDEKLFNLKIETTDDVVCETISYLGKPAVFPLYIFQLILILASFCLL